MKAIFWAVLAMVAAIPAAGQDRTPPSVCLAIDEAHDTFSPHDRQAALMLLAKEFERAHRTVTAAACGERYALAHVQLGNTITVTLTGPASQRDGTAIGMDDLPGLYNQMVRAILTGSTVGAMNVVDRTNVTTPQAEPRRVHADTLGYGRLGYGRVLGKDGSGSPTLGFGFRAEMDSFGLDVSFLNYQLPSSRGFNGVSDSLGGSLLKLEGLYFLNPKGNTSAYFGGGMSWGTVSGHISSVANNAPSSYTYSSWSGSGLQGELTAGYELPRASELRVFLQADATLPFYRVTGQTYESSPGRFANVSLGDRYSPSIAVSVGLGWQRHHR